MRTGATPTRLPRSRPCRRPRRRAPERAAGPTPGAPLISLGAAVRLALGQAFALLDSQDAVAASRWRERTAFSDFLPSRDAALPARRGPQRLRRRPVAASVPWTGGSLTASGRYLTDPNAGRALPAHDRPAPAADAAAPARRRARTPASSSCANARRARAGPGAQPRARAPAHRGRRGARRTTPVIAQRQLLEVARPEPGAHRGAAEVLRGAARGRPREQARRVPRRAAGGAGARRRWCARESALATALERFRALLGAAARRPGRARGGARCRTRRRRRSSRSRCWCSARSTTRLELLEARDQVDDARRSAVARQAEPAAAARPQRRRHPARLRRRRFGDRLERGRPPA